MRADPSSFARPRSRSLGGASLLAVVLASLANLGGPSGLEAQRLELIPHIGLHAPLTSVGRAEVEAGTFQLGKRESSLAWGVSVELGGGTSVGIRGSALFGTSGSFPIEGPGCTDCRADVSVRIFSGALVIHPLPRLIPIAPYVLAGGGIKRHGFDDDDLAEAGVGDAFEDQTNRTLQLGVGFRVPLGVTHVHLEAMDFISSLDAEEGMGSGKTQHDIFLLVGIRL